MKLFTTKTGVILKKKSTLLFSMFIFLALFFYTFSFAEALTPIPYKDIDYIACYSGETTQSQTGKDIHPGMCETGGISKNDHCGKDPVLSIIRDCATIWTCPSPCTFKHTTSTTPFCTNLVREMYEHGCTGTCTFQCAVIVPKPIKLPPIAKVNY